MALVKYNPTNYSPVSFKSFVDRFFNDDLYRNTESSYFSPRVDIAESENQFEIDFFIPGVEKDQVSIDMKDGQLTISGERKLNKEENGRNYHTIESQHGSFRRTFHLPENINQEEVSAKFENGILQIVIPKDEKKVAKRSVTIK